MQKFNENLAEAFWNLANRTIKQIKPLEPKAEKGGFSDGLGSYYSQYRDMHTPKTLIAHLKTLHRFASPKKITYTSRQGKKSVEPYGMDSKKTKVLPETDKSIQARVEAAKNLTQEVKRAISDLSRTLSAKLRPIVEAIEFKVPKKQITFS